MRLGIPHMGNIYIVVKAIANRLGIDLIVPPPTSQRTLSLGVKYSPETACLPFKLTLGNLIEALELGADSVIMGGGAAPCRYGYYHKIQEKILRELGYNFYMVTESHIRSYVIKHFTNGASLWKLITACRFGLAKLKALDELERMVHKIRAIERDKGEASRIYRDGVKAIDNAEDYKPLNQAKQEHLEKLMNLPIITSPDPLKIGVTGEFFVVLDSFANMDIEIELGKLGVEVKRPISVREWVKLNPFIIALGLSEKDRSHKAAMPYLSRHVGGDGWQSVGEKILHARDWDGLVHLEPFGCLPEIMARNIMPSIKDELPVLNIIYDEYTGKAGMITRLEAFVDMIRTRKRRQVEACV
jgi:predicted nucleotide-binding protein (sugar kinase/HSP70/actin superfamily)